MSDKKTKADIVRSVTDTTNYPKKVVNEVFDEVFIDIGYALAAGKSVSIPNLGTFSVSQRAPRMGRNPATGQPMEIPASKGVKFKAAKGIKDTLNS